jgi:hypothetical protein
MLLVAGPAKFLDTIQYPEPETGIFSMIGVVSRKKQLLPFLTDCIGHMN